MIRVASGMMRVRGLLVCLQRPSVMTDWDEVAYTQVCGGVDHCNDEKAPITHDCELWLDRRVTIPRVVTKQAARHKWLFWCILKACSGGVSFRGFAVVAVPWAS